MRSASTLNLMRKPGISRKKYLHALQAHEIERFEKSDDLAMTIYPVSSIPFIERGFTPIQYTKTIMTLPSGNRVFVIKKDDVPVSVTWETTPEHMQKAVFEGIASFSSLTSQVICKMGTYNGIVLERIYENGMISNKYLAKKALLEISQQRVALLQPLERLINSDENIEDVKKRLLAYIKSVNKFKTKKLGKKCETIKKYDADIQKKFEAFLDEDIREIQKLHDHLTEKSLPHLLRAFGKNSLQTKLSTMMVHTIKQAQGINQNLTYARPGYLPESLFRGEFNSMCVDAMHVIHDYEPDLHNAPLSANQGDFSGMLNKKKGEKHIYHSFSVSDKRALAAICKIEGSQSIEETSSGQFVFRTDNNEEIPLTTTRLTHWSALWNTFERKSHVVQKAKNAVTRIGFFILNVVTNVLLTPIDIVLGISGGLLNFELSLVERVKVRLKRDVHETDYNKLVTETTLPSRPVAYYLSYLIGSSVRSVLLDVGSGLLLMGQQMAKFPKFIFNDYYVGGWGDPKKSSDKIIEDFDVAAAEVKADMEASKDKFKEFLDQSQLSPEDTNRRFAQPAYHLSPGEWRDIFSVAPKGLKAFGNTILYSIHDKDHAIGLVYNFFYFAGMIAIFIPAVPLPEVYKTFSEVLASHMAHGTASKGISTAVTQAQFSSILAEIVQRGPHSLLGQIAGKAEENLVDIAVIIFLARTFGDVLRQMPGIGDAIEDELGSTKSIALITYGAKTGVFIKELCEAGEEFEVSDEIVERYKKIREEYFQELAEENLEEKSTSRNVVQEKNFATLSPEEDAAHKKLQFLIKLTEYEDTLPHLSSLMKRELQQEARRLFPDNSEIVSAIDRKLNPEKPLSIASRTLYIVSNYVINFGRIIASIGTGSTQPIKDLFHDIPKDLARVLKFVGGLVECAALVVYATLYTVARAVCDQIFNGILARTESTIRGNKHFISDVTASAASKIGGSYIEISAALSTGTNAIYGAVTHPDANSVMLEGQVKCFEGFYKRPPRQGAVDLSLAESPSAKRISFE